MKGAHCIMVEMIISIAIFAVVALIMTIIGVSQLRSKTPVGFYTGAKPPQSEEISDVLAWNKKHGYMWIAYGISIMLVGIIIGVCSLNENAINTLIILLLSTVGVILPIIVMMIYHTKLEKMYKVR